MEDRLPALRQRRLWRIAKTSSRSFLSRATAHWRISSASCVRCYNSNIIVIGMWWAWYQSSRRAPLWAKR